MLLGAILIDNMSIKTAPFTVRFTEWNAMLPDSNVESTQGNHYRQDPT